MTANLWRRLARIEAQEIPRATFLDVLRCLAGPIDLTADNPFVDYDTARTAPESWARINSEQGKRDLAPLAEAFNARHGGESEADRKLDDEWARKYNAWFVRYEEARRQAVEQGIEFVRPGAEAAQAPADASAPVAIPIPAEISSAATPGRASLGCPRRAHFGGTRATTGRDSDGDVATGARPLLASPP